MWTSENSENLSTRCREALLRAIPAGSLRILEVGCGEAPLAARLKETDGRRTVFGITCDQSSAERARQRLESPGAQKWDGRVRRGGFPDRFP